MMSYRAEVWYTSVYALNLRYRAGFFPLPSSAVSIPCPNSRLTAVATEERFIDSALTTSRSFDSRSSRVNSESIEGRILRMPDASPFSLRAALGRPGPCSIFFFSLSIASTPSMVRLYSALAASIARRSSAFAAALISSFVSSLAIVGNILWSQSSRVKLSDY